MYRASCKRSPTRPLGRSLARSFARAAASLLPQSQFLQHMLALPFFLQDCRTVTVALSRRSAPRSSLIMNHQRHLPLFIVGTIPLDLPPRFSRLLFPVFCSSAFEFIIPPRDSISSFTGERSFVLSVRLSVSRSIKSTLLRRIELNRVSQNDLAHSRANESRPFHVPRRVSS